MFIWHRERQSHTYSLLIPNWTPESGSWSWHVSLPGDKGPYGLCQAITLCGNTFTCCMLSECSFILCPWPSWPWGPQALTFQCFRFHSGVVRVLLLCQREVHIGQSPCVSCQGSPLVMMEIHTLLELILLCVFSMWAKVLFHLVPDCVVSSLVTLIPRCSGQKGLNCGWQWDELYCLPWKWSPPWHCLLVHGVLFMEKLGKTHGKVQPSWPCVLLIWMPKHMFWMTLTVNLYTSWQNLVCTFIFIGQK